MIIESIMLIIDGIMDIFAQGGVITYVILFIGIYGLIIAIRKIAYLKKISKVDTTEIFGVVTTAMERGGAVEALKQINGFKNPISRIISETLKIGYKNKTEVEESMEQIFIVEVGKMTKGVGTIKTLIELAPFLGLIGTVIGIWMTFKSLGVNPDPTAMAEGIYVALTTTIVGLAVTIILIPLHTYIQGLIEVEMDKIELATKMTNWGYAVVKIRVDSNVECALEALQEAEGVVNTRLISDPYANIKVSFKPSMLDKSISNIILEKCNVNAEITESKLRQ
ncbi:MULTISPECIES: MotA/TolQ/ExbB proton channel family protein [Methanobrevibacter]|uniref:MotA/TolQ/ExbB proton channel family protein n=1 Tax=Methanobrevibacter TaxID=2172 RepID=UPI0025FB9DFF|nr:MULTISPECIES: MotA/TolQ/ExbB proton channel family protein [Methanobrevibacter]MCI7429172.1 MotA/TolQ/ExbB proton channel family protein [Methanobrevibacter sp.]MDD6776266.1 MotA/TolQ/ExbB proton channel family protein [Methanobacteriaceae archaeon]MDY3097464.1 MotA/TolQ/ExbB proton channel family protein [Methanobrevibacter sp.]